MNWVFGFGGEECIVFCFRRSFFRFIFFVFNVFVVRELFRFFVY